MSSSTDNGTSVFCVCILQEDYVEYSRHGTVIKGAEKPVVRSKYEEDVFTNNHTVSWCALDVWVRRLRVGVSVSYNCFCSVALYTFCTKHGQDQYKGWTAKHLAQGDNRRSWQTCSVSPSESPYKNTCNTGNQQWVTLFFSIKCIENLVWPADKCNVSLGF